MGVEERGDGRTVQLKRVRLSFTDGLKDKRATVENGKEKHTCNLILESDSDTFAVNKAKCISALKVSGTKEWKNETAWKDLWADDPKRCSFRKGARFKNADGEVYAGYDGNIAVAGAGPSGGQKRPKLLDRLKRPVPEEDILEVCYSGSYCDAIVSFYGTDKGGRGIFCSIDAIRSHQEGDAQGGGGINVENDDFDDMDDDDSFGGGSDDLGDDDLLG